MIKYKCHTIEYFSVSREPSLVKGDSFSPHTLLTEMRLCGNNEGDSLFRCVPSWGALFILRGWMLRGYLPGCFYRSSGNLRELPFGGCRGAGDTSTTAMPRVRGVLRRAKWGL